LFWQCVLSDGEGDFVGPADMKPDMLLRDFDRILQDGKIMNVKLVEGVDG
jgi:hypothetical protein